jgi:hypothetical protein
MTTRRELARAGAGAVMLTVAMTYPLERFSIHRTNENCSTVQAATRLYEIVGFPR